MPYISVGLVNEIIAEWYFFFLQEYCTVMNNRYGCDVIPVDSNRSDAIELMSLLCLAGGADLNAETLGGESPLTVAINAQQSDMVRELLSLGAAVNATSDVAGWGPVHLAARLGRVDLMKALLDHGGDASREVLGSSPLHMAARAGHADIIRLLLLHDADVNAADHAGCLALHYTAQRGDLLATELLLNGGAEVNAQTADGATAAFLATFFGHGKVVEMLVEYDADVSKADSFDQTPLAMARAAGNWYLVRLLSEPDDEVTFV